jgi:hypothetical protein
VRVLVRLEGDAVVLQRRLGEQADGKEERFDTLKDCKDVAVKDPDGKTAYVIRSIFDLELVRTLGKGVEVAVDIKGAVDYRQAGRVQMSRRPENARSSISTRRSPAARPRT